MIGMTSSLLHHQVQGAAWMRERESGTIEPRGGLQADQMGLGKTIMTIATMVANPPTPHDSKCTLIVCSPAIVSQWMSEFARHVEPGVFPKIFRYQASTFATTFGAGNEAIISEADVVLTSYQEVMSSYPKNKPPKEIVLTDKKLEWWENEWTNRSILHKIHFYRVVLDEAQAIKNHKSHTSVACRGLMAKHRWAITGTPIQNAIIELYPFFKFLRVKQTGDVEVFRENFCEPDDEDDTKRLHAMLNQFMIRRSHKERLFGQPIVKLPKNTQKTIVIEFNAVERAIYNAVRRHYIKQINVKSKAGSLEKSYRCMLVC